MMSSNVNLLNTSTFILCEPRGAIEKSCYEDSQPMLTAVVK